MRNNQDFPLRVKTTLWRRKMTVGQLAQRIGRNRTSVSTAIHNTRFPLIREAILKTLSL
jgi:DNA-binding Xre family transcriptional regulator